MTNIAKLLKDCPKGTKLYSPLFGEVKLDDAGGMIYVTTKYGSSKCFTETGCYYVDNETFSTECLLFPGKGQTWGGVEIKHSYKKKFEVGDWITDGCNPPVKVSGFSLGFTYYFSEGNVKSQGWKVAEDDYHHWTLDDAKYGDVLAADTIICIFKKLDKDGYIVSPCIYTVNGGLEVINNEDDTIGPCGFKPATKEAKELLFRKMKEEGYHWDEKKKELKKVSTESKFKVGDWVVFNDNHNSIYQISEIKNFLYMLTHIHGGKMSLSFSQRELLRPWTIADAKDGDVLSFDNETIVVFKDMYNATSFHSHCHLEDGIFDTSLDDMPDWWEANGFKPATKEQRTLFFKKMQEAGYQWYAGKKELRKIVEPKFKAGNWYLCVKDVYYRYVRFDKGNAYHCGKDGCLQQLDSGAHISIVEELYEYFRPWAITDAKDGDVLALNGKPFIYSSHKYGKNYCYIDDCGQFRANFNLVFEGNCVCPATKKQHTLLFKKMREAGYEWDANKKELKKIQPHYDIANFKPFDKVLVRDSNERKWVIDFYGFVDEDIFICTGCGYYSQCIPFEGNEHLLGTTNSCDERFINW